MLEAMGETAAGYEGVTPAPMRARPERAAAESLGKLFETGVRVFAGIATKGVCMDEPAKLSQDQLLLLLPR